MGAFAVIPIIIWIAVLLIIVSAVVKSKEANKRSTNMDHEKGNISHIDVEKEKHTEILQTDIFKKAGIKTNLLYCPNCGRAFDKYISKCPECGSRLKER